MPTTPTATSVSTPVAARPDEQFLTAAPSPAGSTPSLAGSTPSHLGSTPVPAPPASPGKAGRWLVRVVVVLMALAVLLVVATIGAGSYFSSELLGVDHTTEYPVTVLAVGGDAVTLSRDANTARPATVGLTWPGGHAILTDQVILDGNRVVRTVDEIERGTLRRGVHAFIDMHVFDTDPRIGLDMSFSSVAIPDELGPMPAWYVPPTTDVARDTWVIAVHGRGSDRTEALRVLPTVAATGCPSLIISYRNDVGAPASPDGRYHLGDTEWLDVQAAIEYARDHGAARVVLYGWSMGGAVAMTALRRLPPAQVSLVTAVVLDSPVLDWTSTLALQGRQRNLPAPLTWTAERLVERRDQLTLSDFDQRRYAPQLSVPILLFVDRSDTTVPPAASLQFGHLRPDLVTLITTSGGDHTGSWNVDPVRYDDAVRDFLSAHV